LPLDFWDYPRHVRRMLVTEMTVFQLYGLIMLAFVIVMLAGQLLKLVPTLTGKQKFVAYSGLTVMVIGPAFFGAWVLQM
jgi:hypothetical protein